MTTDIIFDGHDAITGMQGGNPVLLGNDKVASSVNRFFRNDENRTRPPFRELNLTFANADDQKVFQTGNVQGAFFYTGRPPTSNVSITASEQLYFPNYIIVAVAGKIFAILLQGGSGKVTHLPDTPSPNNPLLLHTWFAQGYEWLFAQNGEQNCLIWNGQDTTKAANYFRSNPTLGQIPTGGMMAYLYGMMVVTSADGRNQIAVGDQAYSNTQTNSSDIWKFTDLTYWAEGGYFDIAASLGDITGITAMPYLDTGTGQNELVVLCRNGATSFDLSGLRTNWLNSQVQRISLVGMGCVSTHSLALLNGDLLYKANDGIRSYKNSRLEFQSSYSQTPMSYDVDKWLRQENRSLLEFNCQVAWDNMLFSGVLPMLAPSELAGCGYHRFHRGMVVLDCQPQSRVAGGDPAWQGMWTGPRPTAFADGFDSGVHRAFCCSFDSDGVNRVYEFMKDGYFDTSNGSKKTIVSLYDTPLYCGQGSDRFTHKRLIGANIEVSDMMEAVQFSLEYRPDNSICFISWKETGLGCDCAEPVECQSILQQPYWQRVNFGNPKDDCAPGSKALACIYRAAQFRITLVGAATIDRLGILMQGKEQENKQSCEADITCTPIQCCPATDEFSYVFP